MDTLTFAEQLRFRFLFISSSKEKTQPKADLYTASFVHWIQRELLPKDLLLHEINLKYFTFGIDFVSTVLIELDKIHLICPTKFKSSIAWS